MRLFKPYNEAELTTTTAVTAMIHRRVTEDALIAAGFIAVIGGVIYGQMVVPYWVGMVLVVPFTVCFGLASFFAVRAARLLRTPEYVRVFMAMKNLMSVEFGDREGEKQ